MSINREGRPLHVVFVHLDLGIGGAEQLILQLATASRAAGHKIDLVTTRCDPDHCFAAVKPGGDLHKFLHVWGRWIPASIGGKGKALCSHLRLVYLAFCVSRKKAPDLIVVDVLPTPLPILKWTDAALLFYCHFPDLLLTTSSSQSSQSSSLLKSIYRSVMDRLETACMTNADTVVCNSQFTKSVVQETFFSNTTTPPDLPILYPTLEQIPPETREKESPPLIVSLNRYERKKNLELVIQAAAWLRKHDPKRPFRVVIAGGYDVQNQENVQYRAELGAAAKQAQVTIDFRQSISDATRADLLATAVAVLYTPANEHFGIVPLEAMAAGTPVLACRSGGPLETIVDGETGFLCQPTAASFGQALQKLLEDPARATQMGQAARQHVMQHFGPDRLQREWTALVEETVLVGRQRLLTAGQYRWARSLTYVLEALMTLAACLALTMVLRWLGVLEPSQSLWSGMRSMMKRDEL